MVWFPFFFNKKKTRPTRFQGVIEREKCRKKNGEMRTKRGLLVAVLCENRGKRFRSMKKWVENRWNPRKKNGKKKKNFEFIESSVDWKKTNKQKIGSKVFHRNRREIETRPSFPRRRQLIGGKWDQLWIVAFHSTFFIEWRTNCLGQWNKKVDRWNRFPCPFFFCVCVLRKEKKNRERYQNPLDVYSSNPQL